MTVEKEENQIEEHDIKPRKYSLYVGVDVYERESQLAIFGQSGFLVTVKMIPTDSPESFISSLPGEERVCERSPKELPA